MSSSFMPFDASVYINRRKALMEKLGSGRILLLGNDESSINFKDNHYPFRQDSTFLYYFGIDLPGLLAIIDVDKNRTTIFGNELTIDDIVWTGKVPSIQQLADSAGVKRVKPKVSIIKYIDNDIHYLPPYRPEHSILLSKLTGKKVPKVNKRYSVELIMAISGQREIKSSEEVAELNKAVSISHEMHLQVMKSAQVGMKEHDLVGIATSVAWKHHVALSFPPIMTINGQVLHNHDYSHALSSGDMILFDGGCESARRYAGDITRTFPVDKRFTPQQKDLYDIVYSAYTAAIDLSRAGTRFIDVHLGAAKVIAQGLRDVGLMHGDMDEAIAAGAHTMFFQCGLGHMLGLDVHDMENYGEQYIGYGHKLKKSTEFGLKSLRLGKKLKEGFCVTIEPGIYIIPELIEMRKSENRFEEFINYAELVKWKDFGGIRLEDDFIITKDEPYKLGIDMPTSSDQIEEVRAIAS